MQGSKRYHEDAKCHNLIKCTTHDMKQSYFIWRFRKVFHNCICKSNILQMHERAMLGYDPTNHPGLEHQSARQQVPIYIASGIILMLMLMLGKEKVWQLSTHWKVKHVLLLTSRKCCKTADIYYLFSLDKRKLY